MVIRSTEDSSQVLIFLFYATTTVVVGRVTDGGCISSTARIVGNTFGWLKSVSGKIILFSLKTSRVDAPYPFRFSILNRRGAKDSPSEALESKKHCAYSSMIYYVVHRTTHSSMYIKAQISEKQTQLMIPGNR